MDVLSHALFFLKKKTVSVSDGHDLEILESEPRTLRQIGTISGFTWPPSQPSASPSYPPSHPPGQTLPCPKSPTLVLAGPCNLRD